MRFGLGRTPTHFLSMFTVNCGSWLSAIRFRFIPINRMSAICTRLATRATAFISGSKDNDLLLGGWLEGFRERSKMRQRWDDAH